LGAADEGDDFVEADDDVVVTLARLDDAIDVAVEDVGAEGLVAFGVGVGEVAADGRPRDVDDPGGSPEVALGEGSADLAVAVEGSAEASARWAAEDMPWP
jgi:hypothetical protein